MKRSRALPMLPRGGAAAWSLAVVLLAVQSVVWVCGGPEGCREGFECLALTREGVSKGWIWQLVTYAALHGNWTHAFVNAWLTGYFGARVSAILGPGVFWRVMVAGVLGGALFHLAMGAGVALVGASGGVTAMILWLATVSPESRMWPVPVSARNLGLGILLASAVMALWALLTGQAAGIFAISHACHLGGGLAGVLMARWVLRPRADLAKLRAMREKREGRHGGGLR